jgi:hypothetical protein
LFQGGLGLLGPLPLPVLGLLNTVGSVELEANGLLFGPFHLVACLKQEPLKLRFLPGTVGGGRSKCRLQFVTSFAFRLGRGSTGLFCGPLPVS